jgi:Circadian oscillating protein COP23
MKKILSTLTVLSCLASSFTLAPSATSAPQNLVVRFYCGQSFDPNSNKIIPTTLIATSARREPVAFIQWKSKSFGKYTPKSRCAIVSPKLQQAWEAKRLRYLTAGTSPQTGQGIICGSSTKTQCNNSNMLFTLNSGADASEVIARIREIQSGKTSNPIAQSSGDNSVDMQELVTQLGSK